MLLEAELDLELDLDPLPLLRLLKPESIGSPPSELTAAVPVRIGFRPVP